MSLDRSSRLAPFAVALALFAGSLGAQPPPSRREHDERVAHQRPLQVRLRDLPTSQPDLSPGKPESHVQGDPGPGAVRRRGPAAFGPRSRRPVEPAEPEDRDDARSALPSAVTLNQQAITYTNWFPPDAVVAANSSFILAAVNNGITVYDNAGTEVQAFTTFATFFQDAEPAGWQGFYFDPRVAYVADESQFLFIVLGRDDVNATSYAFLAVSQTSDPSGDWWLYTYRADKGPDVDSWLDFPALAGDEWGVYFTGNYFDVGGGGFQHTSIWSINPAVYAGGSGNGNKKSGITWPSSGAQTFAIQPAVPHSTASGEETFFVATFTGSGDEVLLMTMTGDRTSAPPLALVEVPIQDYDQIGPNVDQPGASADLEGGDCRVGNAVYAQRRVYIALSTDPDNNGAAGGVILAKINVDTGAAEWESLTRSAVNNPLYYFYPAVAINSGADTTPKIAWFGTWSGPAQNPSTLYRLFDGDAAHTPIEFISTKTGLSDYQLLDNSNRNRWGDYSGATLLSGTTTMCGLSEYAASNTTWSTRLVCVN
jgi:hypothetical protein